MRALIGIELKDGFKTICCNQNGGLTGAGQQLLDHYSDSLTTLALLEKGDIESLKPTPELTQTQGAFEPVLTRNVKELRMLQKQYSAECVYILMNGRWKSLVNNVDLFLSLSDCVALERASSKATEN